MINEQASHEEQQARAFFANGDYVNAEVFFRRLAAAAPENPVAIYNLGVTLGKMDRIEEALACYRRAIELNPSFADAYTNFGICLNGLNLISHARQGFALARQLAPGTPIPVLNEGIAALALGDYATGWKDFAARWELPAYARFKRPFPQPCWNGEDIDGKMLFLFAEQGFGDTLQMVRYLPLLAARGAKVTIEVPPALTRLIGNAAGEAQVITKGDPIPDFDYYCAMMDIPRACGTELSSVPDAVPYLSADHADFTAPPRVKGKRRIGLCWAGRSSHENDANRSLKFDQLAPLLALENIEWVSVQRLVSDADAPLLATSPVVDWGKDFTDFATAAAAIDTLDIVITVDTAIAHLAGALGKTVWILLPFYADWRWLIEREDSPWYPTARLFRQRARKDWAEVVTRVAAELNALPPCT